VGINGYQLYLTPNRVGEAGSTYFGSNVQLKILKHEQELQTIGKLVGIKELRNAIPKHCFKPSIRNSLLWICHDIILAITLASLAYRFIPQVETPILRYATWAAYGWLEGLVFTGIWVCQVL